ncbi:MAG: PEP-CTERM sorting domain-containing protein [Verrucomicrobiia bacterium]
MKTLKIVAIIGVLSLWANLQSMAVTDLILYEGLPDLAGGTPGMDVTYDAGSDTFLASGYTFDYNISDGHGGATDIGVSVPDTYILSATINHSGVLTGGTLAINGAVGDGDTSVTLLTGNLVTGAAGTAFGYGDNDNDQFQFLFTVNGGTLESAFGGNGAAGGIILDSFFHGNPGTTPFTGSWTSDFNNIGDAGPGGGNGLINSFSMVPEPSSILLVLVGSILFAGGYRSRRNALRV